jgi:hypothetical protein
MRRVSTVLAVLLVAQLILTAGTWLGAGQADGPKAQRLITLDKDEIETLRLTKGADDEGVRLERHDAGWRLPASDGYPAKAGKVENLVAELAGIEPGLPVASSAAAHGRFDLGSDGAQRRVVINEGQSNSATLLIGKSAGTSRVYVRRADSDAVHEIRFASWQASPDPANWFDTDRLQIPIQEVRRVELDGFNLVNKDDAGWAIEGAEPDGEVSTTSIREFVAKATQPTFDAVGQAGGPDREPAAGYTVVTKDGSEHRFNYYSPEDGAAALLVRSDQGWRYRVGSELFKAVRDVTPGRFVATDGEGQSDRAGTGSRSGGSG